MSSLFNSGPSKSELLHTIDVQKRKLDKYELKLKDVIRAYKGLLAEKGALEQSLNVLSASKPTDDVSILSDTEHTEIEKAEGSFSRNSSVASLQQAVEPGTADKVDTLRNALSVITAEKTKLEVAWKENRKQLIEEHDRRVKGLENEIRESKNVTESLEQQLNEAKASVRQARRERECEQNDHQMMLKELQAKLSHERNNREHFQKQVTLQQAELADGQQAYGKSDVELSSLKSEIGRLKTTVKALESAAKKTNEKNDLIQEMNQLKINHQKIIEIEQMRSNSAEKQLSSQSNVAESRVTSLENRISELSATLGDAQRTHQVDLDCVEQLKARIILLDQENQNLAKNSPSESNSDTVENMVEKLQNVHAKLLQKDTGGKLNFYDILNIPSPYSESSHSKCQREFENLRNEFEKYKIKAQSMLKTKNGPPTSSNETLEIDQLKSTVNVLREKLEKQRVEHKSIVSHQEKNCSELRQAIGDLKESHRLEIGQLATKSSQKVNELESEMHKQRNRTLDLLADKERELDHFKILLKCQDGTPPPPKSPKPASIEGVGDQSGSRHRRSESIPMGADSSFFAPISPHSVAVVGAPVGGRSDSPSNIYLPSTFTGPNEQNQQMTSLYYSQELSRMKIDLSNSQSQKRELESAMREVQHAAITKELQYFETMENLKEQIRCLEGSLARLQAASGSENLSQIEYLKNVLVRYMLCEDPSGKEHMLKAIGVVLKLTPKERDNINVHNHRWYWWSTKPGGR